MFFLETFLRHGAQNEQNKYCPRCIDGHSWICFMKTWFCFSAKPLKESGQIWRFMFLTNPLKESRQTTLQETYSCWRMVSSYFALILCFISPAAIHKRCFRFCSSRKRQTPPWTLAPRQCNCGRFRIFRSARTSCTTSDWPVRPPALKIWITYIQAYMP